MPVLKNARWERYARGIIKGKTGEDAHAEAGYKRNRANAVRLKSNKLIRARIEELQAKTLKNLDISVESIVAELDDNRRLAVKLGQAGAATQATLGKAKLLGYVIDKQHVSGPGGKPIQTEAVGSGAREELDRMVSAAGKPVLALVEDKKRA